MSAAEVRDLPVANIGIVRDFLAQSVGDHIHVVAIAPDGQPLPYGRFFGEDAEGAANWAVRENAKGYNLYWTVNIVRPGLNKKPKKEDMRGARYLHVDVDPPKDGTPFRRAELIEQMCGLREPATYIIDSGNGLQGFWRLDEIALNMPAVEHLNVRLSRLFGGDHCHNIDRLMRIPGTVNFPDENKKARGRVPTLASIVVKDAGETIETEALDAILPAAPLAETSERLHVALSGVVPITLADAGIVAVDPLYPLILAGDPNNRSEALLKAVGILVRRGKSDAMIAGLVLNPAYAISAHCYDKPNPMRPVSRAIGRARADQMDNPGNAEPERSYAAPPPPPIDHGGSGGGNSPPGPAAEVSEDVIALAFTSIHRDTLRYDHDIGRWFRWNGCFWRRDETDLALDYARKFARDLADGKRALCKASVASGAERFARADRAHAVTHEIWDADPFLLGTPGGTVDLRTGVMTDPQPDQYISKQTSITPEHGEPVLWLKFLHEAMDGSEELVRFLQLWCGYCLTGDTREHALTFAYGDGGNGKGVFMNTFTGIMGDYAVTSGMETFTASRHDRHSTELAMLRGARLVTASETEEGRAWAEAKIKSMTGGDPITARFMRQDNFTFRPQFKLMIAGNHAPTLRNVDDAMRRRFNIIPFTTKPTQPDRQLEVKLQAEWGQILAWAIRGCRAWLTDGLTRPDAVLTATKEYFADQDLAGQWFEERCEVMSGRFDTCAKFYADWVAFAKEHGEEPGSNKSFGQMMKKRGFISESMRSTGIVSKVYKGIALQLKDFGDDR
jgi:P4 family phage/plasmid primase-like protien